MTAPKIPADLLAFFELIAPIVSRTWSAIGYDLVSAVGEDEMDGYIAIEGVFDADRMTTFGGEDGRAAQELLTEACSKYGWPVVATNAAAFFRLY